jgi:ABC-type glutathione transport system ATPase component
VSALLAAQDVVVEYRAPRAFLRRGPGEPIPALAGASVAVERGQALGIVGESGAGKTTLAMVLAGLVKPDRGAVYYDGVILRCPREKSAARLVQLVFQDPGSSLNPALSVRRVLGELLRSHALVPPEAVPDRCSELLDLVHLPQRVLDARPRALAGGERQRVALARALAVEPAVLILDEALAALDSSVQAAILAVVRELRSRLGVAVVLVAHDLGVVRAVCTEVAVMDRGVLVERGPLERVFAEPAHDRTRSLLAAAPRLRGQTPVTRAIRDAG